MAIGDLPTIGTCSYGSVTFNETVETTDLRITPVYDPGGRTVTHSVYAITLRQIMADQPSRHPNTVRAAIADLEKAGLPFRYRNRGIGDLDVNVGGKQDVLWGPRPRIVSIKPLGGNRAVELTWSVDVAIPTCADAVFAFSPLAFSFRLDFDILPNGDTTRTYSGTLKVPNNRSRVGGRVMKDSPDAYRESIVPDLMPGFRRTRRNFSIDESRTELRFAIVDEQMPAAAPPPAVTLCSASHGFASDGLAKWGGTLQAEYELTRGGNPAAALIPFFALLTDRVNTAQAAAPGIGLPAGAAANPLVVLPVRTSVDEPTIYGPGNTRVRVSTSYVVINQGLPGILASGGLWRPVPGSAWNVWAASVSTALGPRGTAGVRFTLTDDKLVDLCGKAEVVTPVAPAPSLPDAPPPRPAGGPRPPA